MLQGEVLVLELVAVDGLATGSVPGSEVSTLKNIHLNRNFNMNSIKSLVIMFVRLPGT